MVQVECYAVDTAHAQNAQFPGWCSEPQRSCLAGLGGVRASAGLDRLRRRTRRTQPLRPLARGLPYPCGVGCVGGRSDCLSTTAQPRRLVHLGPRVVLLARRIRTPVRDLRGPHRAWRAALRQGDDLADLLDLVLWPYPDDLLPAALLPGRTPRVPTLEMGP